MVDLNRDELLRVWKHIQENPSRHDQGAWVRLDPRYCDRIAEAPRFFSSTTANALRYYVVDDEWQCGTTACFAGWTALLNGWRPVGPHQWVAVTNGVEVRDVDDIAIEILGLTRAEAFALFYANEDEIDQVINELVTDRELSSIT